MSMGIAFLVGATHPVSANPLHNAPAKANATVTASTVVLSIPAAAFTPYEDGYDYQNDARYLQHFDNPSAITGARGWYFSAAQLPHGATVTKITFYYRDNSSNDGIAKLQRTDLKGSFVNMASIDTSGTLSAPWYGSKSTTAISYANIDNSKYAYWVVWDLPHSSKPPNDQMNRNWP